MRKFLPIIAFALVSVTASAQSIAPVKQARKIVKMAEAPMQKSAMVAPTTVEAQLPAQSYVVSKQDFKSQRDAAIKKAEGTLEADYGMPEGALYWGYTADWYGYTAMIAQTHAMNENVIFKNYSSYDEIQDVTFTWTRSGSNGDVELDQTADNDGIGYLWGYSQTPKLTAVQGDQTSTFQQLSPRNSNTAYWYAGMNEFEILTNACPGINTISGYTGAGGYQTKTQFYGTEKQAVGIASTFDAAPGVIYTDTLVVNGWFDGEFAEGTTAADILGNNELTATIYTFDAEGNWVEYASATCNKDNVIFNPEYGNVGLQFTFQEEDELFGAVDAPITLPREDFIVTVTGFEKLNYSFITLMTAVGQLGWRGHSYAILEDGSLATIGYSNYPSIPQSELFIQFHAIEAVAVPVEYNSTITVHDVVQIPVEGGSGVTVSDDEGNNYNDFSVYAWSPIDEWSLDYSDDSMSEWLQVTYDDKDYANGVLSFFFSTEEALPEGVQGRGGIVTLSLYGVEIPIAVAQGEYVFTGVEGVTAAKANVKGTAYNLSGQKVSGSYKGLLIRDGKKFFVK